MPVKLAEADQMTIEEFLAFTDERPDGERWELIEGVATASPLPTQLHQAVVGNTAVWLLNHKAAARASWMPILGIGTRVPISPNSLPRPDLYVQQSLPTESSVTDDALVIFEVLSRSNTKADRAWRKRVYASVPNCQHYVTISAWTAEVIRHDRVDGWREEKAKGLDAELALAAIGVTIPLRTIYRWTPIA